MLQGLANGPGPRLREPSCLRTQLELVRLLCFFGPFQLLGVTQAPPLLAHDFGDLAELGLWVRRDYRSPRRLRRGKGRREEMQGSRWQEMGDGGDEQESKVMGPVGRIPGPNVA